jgi:hypothetical protein
MSHLELVNWDKFDHIDQLIALYMITLSNNHCNVLFADVFMILSHFCAKLENEMGPRGGLGGGGIIF